MNYDTRTYFEENDADDVKGFTIIEKKSDTEEYLIGEKWNRPQTESRWIQYWIPETQLLKRVKKDKCSPKAQLSSEQFSKVCEKLDHNCINANKASA